MNAYDFDGTIYDGDSTIDFYLFCLRKNPRLSFFWIKQFWYAVKYVFGIVSKTEFKEVFFCFLSGLDDTRAEVVLFWDKYENKIKKWYFAKKKDDDVVISASPEFLLVEICNRIGVSRVIASRIDPKTGKYIDSGNCYGEEKVRRYQDTYNDITINEFYSDSLSDYALTQISESSFFVQGNKVTLWRKRSE